VKTERFLLLLRAQIVCPILTSSDVQHWVNDFPSLSLRLYKCTVGQKGERSNAKIDPTVVFQKYSYLLNLNIDIFLFRNIENLYYL